MSLHIECSTVPRDHFGKLLSPLEQADALLFSQTLAAGEISEPLPVGAGLLLTLTSSVDVWVAIGAEPDPTQLPRRWLPAGTARSFETNGGIRTAWLGAAPIAERPVQRRTKTIPATP